MDQNTTKETVLKDAPKHSLDITHLKVLIVDNDAFSLSALEQLLRAWQCDVITWDGNPPFPDYGTAGPDLVIADYHLDADQNGIDLIVSMGLSCPSIICSADSSEALRQACIDNNIGFIRKPIKPLSLKRLIMHLNQG
jgi:CheY-like chemotaxis protein